MTVLERFAYDTYAQTPMLACPICGRENPSTPKKDRYGFPVGVSRCACTFGYLNPQMSREGYAEFYQHAYRPLVGDWRVAHGFKRDDDPNDLALFAAQRGHWIAQGGHKFWQPGPDLRACDIGGSLGDVAQAFVARFPVGQMTIVDAAPQELTEARAKGFKTICALADDFPDLGPMDVILCMQTLDHVLKPLEVLQWMRRLVTPTGWLFVDILDVTKWLPQPQWKLDHPCYWTPKSLILALQTAGWRPRVTGAYGLGGAHYGVWASPDTQEH